MQSSLPGQLDLFIHSRAIVLANEVVDSLLERNVARAADCLRRLRAEAPEHCAIDAFAKLCRALAVWPMATPDPFTTARVVRWLESEVESTAQTVLGPRTPQFMRTLWRELTDAVRDQPYVPEVPEAFCAALYLRCGNALAAHRAAAAIADRECDPAVLHWRTVASYRAEGLRACRATLFRLALLTPQRLPTTLAEMDDRQLQRDWNAFRTVCDWLDPKDQTSAAWFPVWYLVEHQAASTALDGVGALPESRPAQTFVAISRLLQVEPGGYSASLIAARAELRGLSPEFFALYMTRRSVMGERL